ncbi:MAG: mitomycin resistance protein [Planctomycetes bacterium]|nr:mitomycin resistance protein [Planctomycetota bacterium]
MARRISGRGTGDGDAAAIRELCRAPNVGPATAGDLLRLGIRRIEDLAGKDPDRLYDALCRRDGAPHDVCVRDVFHALVLFAETGEARPWWFFSQARKAREARGADAPRPRTHGSPAPRRR